MPVSELELLENKEVTVRLLLGAAVEDRWIEQIREISSDIEVETAFSREDALEKIPEAHAFYGRIRPELLKVAAKLQWVQNTGIGLEGTVFPELAESEVILTNMRGIYSDHIADHVFAFILCFARGFYRYIRRQASRVWAKSDETAEIHLPDQTLGIIGLGGIGSEVARRGAAFGMRVVAVDPHPRGSVDHVGQVWGLDGLYEMLGQADFVAICTPHTPQTRGMINREALRRMRRTAYLINIGRGVIVNLDALVWALQTGEIAGAGLDVFEVEPLPADSPLWEMENVLITPHVAGRGPYIEERKMRLFLENIRRFVQGEELLTVVDKRVWC